MSLSLLAAMEFPDLDFEDFNFSLWNNGSADDDSLYSDWCEAGEQKATIQTFQTCLFSVIFLLGTVGNGLVIATFATYRCGRLRSMTDVFLLHLALADLLLLLTLPLQALDTHLGWILPASLCRATRACYSINTYSGLLLLACISVDRYLVVARPQVMHRLRMWIFRVGMLAAVGVWAMAAVLSLPEILFSEVSGSGSHTYCVLTTQAAKMATRGAIIALFCLSLTVMVTCYAMVARVLWEGQGQRRGKQWQQQRTLKLMLALVLLFLAFQLPYTLVLLQKLVGGFCGPLLEYVTSTLAYTRCCLNPVLYALVGVRFRHDVQRLLHKAGCSCRGRPTPLTASSASASSPALTALLFGSGFFSSEPLANNK